MPRIDLDVSLDIHSPESPDDEGDLGTIYIDGWGYTPNDVREFIEYLRIMVDTAEDAVRA